MKLKTIKLISLALSLALIVAQSSFAGAPQKQGDENGVTELMRAVRDGETSKVRKLLKKPENLNAQDEWGWTALMYATNNGDETIVKDLIKSGADVNIRDMNGMIALNIARIAEARARASGASAALSQRQAILVALKGAAKLAIGSQANQKPVGGMTELMRAASDGEVAKVKNLLKQGADINAQNERGGTALMIGALKGNGDIVNALLEHNADVNVKAKDGATALMYAAMNGDEDIVNALLKSKADVNAKIDNGKTALALALERESTARMNAHFLDIPRREAIVKALKEAGAVESPKLAISDIKKPVVLNRLHPRYTEDALQNKVSGIVIMRLLIGEDGRVKKVRIMRGLPHGLSDSAKWTASQLLFKPATKDGQPVEYWIPIEMGFSIK